MASFKVGEAPWETAPKTANSARPSDLTSPVPKEAAVEAPEVGGFEVGKAPWDAADTPVVADTLAASDMSPLPAPEGMASAKEQVNEGFTRLRNAFASTDRESLETLKSSGMFGDVLPLKSSNIPARPFS